LLFLGAVAISTTPLLSFDYAGSDKPKVSVGAKTFTEQYILAEMIAERLREAEFDVTLRDGLGSTVVFDALANDEIDVYVDYSGTIWANHLKREKPERAEIVLVEIERWLLAEHGIVSLGALGFENAYAFAMRRDRAKELGIETLDDLAARSSTLSIGGDYEFFSRPEWIAVRDDYGMNFAEQRSFDSTLMYTAVSERHVDVISAFSTDGRIAALDLVVLDDPRHSLPPYDGVLLLSKSASENSRLVEVLRPLIGSLDDSIMREANRRVDLDHRPVAEVAHDLGANLPR
jgi:osmoprotectant transport system permease protein